jgi:hypothetical protein
VPRQRSSWSLGGLSLDRAGRPPADAPFDLFAGSDEGDTGQPQWVFGQTTYLPEDGHETDGSRVVSRLSLSCTAAGRDHLTVVRPRAGTFGLDGYTSVDGLAFTRDGIAVLGALVHPRTVDRQLCCRDRHRRPISRSPCTVPATSASTATRGSRRPSTTFSPRRRDGAEAVATRCSTRRAAPPRGPDGERPRSS